MSNQVKPPSIAYMQDFNQEAFCEEYDLKSSYKGFEFWKSEKGGAKGVYCFRYTDFGHPKLNGRPICRLAFYKTDVTSGQGMKDLVNAYVTGN